jgi:hypothetical protein
LGEGFEIYTYIHLNICCTTSSKVWKQPEYKKMKINIIQSADCQIVVTTRCQLVTPAAYHYKCLVDVLVANGRAIGRFGIS